MQALVRAGCLDCLREAYHGYYALLRHPAVRNEAAAAAARVGALIAIRERELGIIDTGALDGARALAAPSAPLAASLELLFEIIETLGAGGSPANGPVTSDAQLAARSRATRNRTAWTEALRTRADEDELTAYLWVAFSCTYNVRTNDEADVLLSVVPAHRDTPLIRFRLATCTTLRMPVLEQLLGAEPRFAEIRYYLALQALVGGDLDAADMQLADAYLWSARWPAVTNLRGSVFMTAEDFGSAADYYARTIALVPDHADALLGRVRALTYQGRYLDALTAVDALLAVEGWYVGDAHYWRATNELQLGRYEEAWVSVERAAALITNAAVPKLAGIIAVERQQPQDARRKFEEAQRRNAADCETSFYLGVVLSGQREWALSVDTFMAAANCLEQSEADLAAQIAAMQASPMPPERKARQVERRRRQLASEARMRVTSWFNTAAAAFNLSRFAEARQYAERVLDDEQFADRARQLLSRLPPS
jgi:tetratricopeptide (TPR) repeat protein